MAKITVITGTPGVGKSTLARLLAQRTRAQLLDLGKFVKQKKLYSKYDKKARSYVIDEPRVRRELQKYFSFHEKEELIIDTHTLGTFFPANRRTIALVIRLDPLVLGHRLKLRQWSKEKIWDNVESELIDLSLFEAVRVLGRARVWELDATGKGRRELSKTAWKILARVKMPKQPVVDWLGLYDPVELSRRLL